MTDSDGMLLPEFDASQLPTATVPSLKEVFDTRIDQEMHGPQWAADRQRIEADVALSDVPGGGSSKKKIFLTVFCKTSDRLLQRQASATPGSWTARSTTSGRPTSALGA